MDRDQLADKSRFLSDIAQEIWDDWGDKTAVDAKPYLLAMFSVRHITDKYGADDAETIVLYFLSNASTWRGDTAKRVKNELKSMLKTLKKR